MDQGSSQDENNAENDETVKNEVKYFLMALFETNPTLYFTIMT